jgi:hypothetical protein
MDLTAPNLSVNEAQEYLALNGVSMTQVWIRTLIKLGKIKSKKIFSSRVIPKTELNKMIKERK